MKRKMSRTLMMVLILCDFALADFPWIIPPNPPLEAESEINQLFYLNDFNEAAEKYLEIYETSSDQSIKARVLLDAGHMIAKFKKDFEAGRALYEQLINEYPGTRYEIWGEVGLINMEHPMPSVEKNTAISALLSRQGAPTLEQAQSQEPDASVAAIESLHPEIAYALSDLYLINAYELQGAGLDNEALRIAEMGRWALEPLGGGGSKEFLSIYLSILAKRSGVEEFSIRSISQEPIVESVLPAEGSTVDSNVSIEIQLTAGDFRYAQLDLDSLAVTLDGEDVKYDLSTRMISSGELTEGVNLETVILSLERALPAGAHTVSLSVKTVEALDRTIGETSKTWTFSVGTPPPPIETLPSTKDTIIDNFDPNGNEGANGILALDKLLGRSSRSLVAFDLSDVETNNLTKATLVLSIHREERIFGCGSGENISVQALTRSWMEGNGRACKVFPLRNRSRGSGLGATWQRDTDTNIRNFRANGGTAWNGAQSAAMPRTAPLVVARDDMEGTLQFDVTQDVLNGASHGWLVRKQHENLASRISFYSREGASAAGDPELAPRLILEFGGPIASAAPADSFLTKVGIGSIGTKLRLTRDSSELPSVREILQDSPVAALAAEQFLCEATRTNPVLNLSARTTYRSWLAEDIRLAAAPSMVQVF